MMNFQKTARAGVSLIGMSASRIAAGVLAAFAAGTLPDLSVGSISPRDLMLPGSPHLPRNKRGRCKHGGRSKARRNLNYWRD